MSPCPDFKSLIPWAQPGPRRFDPLLCEILPRTLLGFPSFYIIGNYYSAIHTSVYTHEVPTFDVIMRLVYTNLYTLSY